MKVYFVVVYVSVHVDSWLYCWLVEWLRRVYCVYTRWDHDDDNVRTTDVVRMILMYLYRILLTRRVKKRQNKLQK